MDAKIKTLHAGKGAESKHNDFRSAELDPSEFLASAIRPDQQRPSRDEAEQAVKTLIAYIGEDVAR